MEEMISLLKIIKSNPTKSINLLKKVYKLKESLQDEGVVLNIDLNVTVD